MIENEFIFESFDEFCEKADDILKKFKLVANKPNFDLKKYKNYIYNEHCFCIDKQKDMRIKDKCWAWLMSYKYEKMSKNDLYCTLGMINKQKRREKNGNSL